MGEIAEGFYCQRCGATSRATCDCRSAVLARRLEERADVEAAWRAAADQAHEYIRKHAEERTARKRAEAELAALRATIAEQAATIASLRDRERTIREAVNAYLSEQIISKRKLTDAMLAHLPELHGGDSDY